MPIAQNAKLTASLEKILVDGGSKLPEESNGKSALTLLLLHLTVQSSSDETIINFLANTTYQSRDKNFLMAIMEINPIASVILGESFLAQLLEVLNEPQLKTQAALLLNREYTIYKSIAFGVSHYELELMRHILGDAHFTQQVNSLPNTRPATCFDQAYYYHPALLPTILKYSTPQNIVQESKLAKYPDLQLDLKGKLNDPHYCQKHQVRPNFKPHIEALLKIIQGDMESFNKEDLVVLIKDIEYLELLLKHMPIDNWKVLQLNLERANHFDILPSALKHYTEQQPKTPLLEIAAHILSEIEKQTANTVAKETPSQSTQVVNMRKTTPVEVTSVFQKHLAEVFPIISAKENSRHFYFLLSGLDINRGRIEGSKCWTFASQQSAEECHSFVLKPGFSASEGLDELIDPSNKSFKISMTCQMAVQLAYYVALMRTCQELKPEVPDLFNKIFPSKDFVLRDYTITAGSPFSPSANGVFCIGEFAGTQLHPLLPFIEWRDLTDSTFQQRVKKNQVVPGDIMVFNNFPDYENLRQQAHAMGSTLIYPHRRFMVICSSIKDGEPHFTAFGFNGRSLSEIQMAAELVNFYNLLLKETGSRTKPRTSGELLSNSKYFYAGSGHHQHINSALLAVIFNNPELGLSYLHQFHDTLTEEVKQLRKLQFKESPDKQAGKAYAQAKKAYNAPDYAAAIPHYLKTLFYLNQAVLMGIQTGEVDMSCIEKRPIIHYNLGRCYEEIGNFAAAAYHFGMNIKVRIAILKKQPEQKHQESYDEAFNQAFSKQESLKQKSSTAPSPHSANAPQLVLENMPGLRIT